MSWIRKASSEVPRVKVVKGLTILGVKKLNCLAAEEAEKLELVSRCLSFISSLKFCCSISAVEIKIAGNRLFFDGVERISVLTLSWNLMVTI